MLIESNKNKNPSIIWKIHDVGIINYASLSQTTPESLSYLIPGYGTKVLINILNTDSTDIIDCEWNRTHILYIEWFRSKFNQCTELTLENGDILEFPTNDDESYYIAAVTRPKYSHDKIIK